MVDSRYQALILAHAKAREGVEERAQGFLSRLLDRMVGRWFDDQAVAGFVRDAGTTVREAQNIISGLTYEYLDRMLDEMGVTPPKTPLPTEYRRVPQAVEWERVAKTYRAAISEGLPPVEAQSRAANRATTMASDDMGLAQSVATAAKLKDAGPAVIGYRRVIHPEVSSGGTCGLCAVASDMRYKTGELMPLHTRCACSVAPITRDADPGSSLNEGDLEKMYAEAGGTSGTALSKIKYKVTVHSELGPRLKPDSEPAGLDSEPETKAELAAELEDWQPEAEPEPARDPRGLSDDDLDDEVAELMAVGDFDSPRMQSLAHELERREAANLQRQQDMDREEWEQQQAKDRAEGIWRRPAGPSKADREKALRDDYETWLEIQFVAAEEVTNGVMLSRAGQAEGIDPRDLFNRRRRNLRKWASEELQRWFADNPRMSYQEFRAGAADDDIARVARQRSADRGWESEFG